MTCCNPVQLLNCPQFSTIKALLDQFGLTGAVLSLQNGTVYLPTNCAFSKIKAVIATLTPDQIEQILLYHVSPQQVVGRGNTVLCTLNGAPLLASPEYVNNIEILTSCTTKKNNTTFNTINTVLIPFNATQCLVQQ
jgi:uncharacterized surface protein with fasciclin (FAS1) repeats